MAHALVRGNAGATVVVPAIAPVAPCPQPARDPSLGDAGGAEVVVRVLGPVDVLGAARPFERAWTLDLVAYLAVHPEGVPADVWSAALWPDRPVADATRHSTVSAARRALGADAEGRDHLPRRHGRLALGPEVTSDWARFSELAVVTGVGASAAWESALALVRGRPFEGLRAPDWPVLEGLQAAIEDAVVQVALRLAQCRLVEGDGWAAEHAARRALLVCPYDERLYRMVMRAADHQGNPAGVERAMAELSSLLGGGTVTGHRAGPLASSESAWWVHPETANLYRSLSRRAQVPCHQGPCHRDDQVIVSPRLLA